MPWHNRNTVQGDVKSNALTHWNWYSCIYQYSLSSIVIHTIIIKVMTLFAFYAMVNFGPKGCCESMVVKTFTHLACYSSYNVVTWFGHNTSRCAWIIWGSLIHMIFRNIIFMMRQYVGLFNFSSVWTVTPCNHLWWQPLVHYYHDYEYWVHNNILSAFVKKKCLIYFGENISTQKFYKISYLLNHGKFDKCKQWIINLVSIVVNLYRYIDIK